jgi:hypothetical protein
LSRRLGGLRADLEAVEKWKICDPIPGTGHVFRYRRSSFKLNYAFNYLEYMFLWVKT